MATPDSCPRPKLSVALLVRDERDVLETTLSSVRSVADEIVVLDIGSTDGSSQLAEQLGAVVHHTGWTDDFSAARNRLLDLATGEWILWLEAGERLEPTSAAVLRQFLDTGADSSKAYTLWIEIPPTTPSGSAEKSIRPRLMPKTPKLRFHGRVCETIDESLEAAGFRIDAAPGRILRDRQENDLCHRQAAATRNLRLIELEAAEQGRRSVALMLAAGDALSDLADWAAAETAFSDAIEAAEHGSREMLEGYYGLLATLAETPGSDDRLVSVCLEALEIYPLDAQLLLAMGNYMEQRNQLALAARAYRTATVYGQVNVEIWHLDEIAQVAAGCFARTLQLQGKDDEARQVLVEALSRQPGSNRLRRHLLNLHVKHGRLEEAVRLARLLAEESPGQEAFCDAVRGACQAASQDWAAAIENLEAALAAGCNDSLCLRWLAVALLANGQAASAERVIRQWLQHEPENLDAQRYLAAAGAPPRQEPGRTAANRLRIDNGQKTHEPRSRQESERRQAHDGLGEPE